MRVAGGRGDEAGFVLVDALTAVAIISLMLAVCLGTVKIARIQSRTVAEMTEARVVLSALMETTPRLAGQYSGVDGSLTWQASVTQELVNDTTLCRIDVTVHVPKRKFVYRLTGTRWCTEKTA